MLENPPILLPQNIRFLRKRNKLSQEELASKIGLNRGNIASYEKGTAEPKICNLLKIARLFAVSIRDLTGIDLSQVKNLNGYGMILAKGHHAKTTTSLNRSQLEKHLTKAEELQTVVSSLYNCHCFKLKNIEVSDKDTQVLVSNFEQLYEITHSLLHSHQELLELVKEKNNHSIFPNLDKDTSFDNQLPI